MIQVLIDKRKCLKILIKIVLKIYKLILCNAKFLFMRMKRNNEIQLLIIKKILKKNTL